MYKILAACALAIFVGPLWAEFPPPDQVQECLDKTRLERLQKQQGTKGKPAETVQSHQVDPSQIPITCADGSLDGMRRALQKQIVTCKKKSEKALAGKTFQFGCRNVTQKDYCLNTAAKMLDLVQKSWSYKGFLKRMTSEFDWYQLNGRNEGTTDGKFKPGDTQMTGYYAPDDLEVAQSKNNDYRYPIYKSPEGLDCPAKQSCGADPLSGLAYKCCLERNGASIPVPTRAEITAGNPLVPESDIIGYAKNISDNPFLQIEGSGVVKMHKDDGSVQRMVFAYSAQNGRTRYMLSGVLDCMGVDRKKYPKSEEGIRNFIDDHPDIALQTENMDQSFVFFKKMENGDVEDSIVGADDTPVTAMHSIATDPSVIPTGATTLFNVAPEGNNQKRCSTTALAQDTGGAIKGAHIDRYMGHDKRAKDLANSANDPGDVFMAVPKGAGTPIEGCTENKGSIPSVPISQ